MMKQTLLLILFLHLVLQGESVFLKYVSLTVPGVNSSQSCPSGEECLTFNEYAKHSDRHFQSNTMFIFLRGNHQLNTTLRFEGIQNLSLQGESDYDVTISIGLQVSLMWTNCENIAISLLQMKLSANQDYDLAFINTSTHIANSSFNGGGTAGLNSLLFKSSTVQIKDSQFIGLTSQLGALSLISQTSLLLSGMNVFQNNTARLGAAIYAVESTVTISGVCRFAHNHARDWITHHQPIDLFINVSVSRADNSNRLVGFGGAIFGDNSHLVIKDVLTFVSNSAERAGGAVAIINNSTLMMEIDSFPQTHFNIYPHNASFIQNKVTSDYEGESLFINYGSGGAIYAENSKMHLTATTFFNNTSPVGGGALYFNHSIVTMHNFTVVNNSAYIAGAVYVDNKSDLEISGLNYYEGNSVSTSGGVIYTSNLSMVRFSGANFFTNNLAQRGGGVYVYNASAQFEGTNSFVNHTSGRGSAIYLSRVDVKFDGKNDFRHNSGGSDGRGSAVYMFDSSLTFNGTTYFEENYANRGGALYLSNSTVNFYGNTYFYRNSALTRGGAMLILLSTVVFCGPGEIIFEDNYSNSLGGMAFLSNGNITFSDEESSAIFSRNVAAWLGGTIVSYDGYLQLRGNVTFDGGRADYGGALALVGTSSMRLNPRLRLNFINNQANFDGGAIYFADSVSSSQCISTVPIECFISMGSNLLSHISLTFINNYAKMSGNSLYGGQLHSCRLYFGNDLSKSTLCQDRTGHHFSDNALDILRSISTISMSDISSNPVKICVCENLSSSSGACSDNNNVRVSVMPGEQFKLSVATLGQAEHTVNSTVLNNNVVFSNDYRLSPSVQSTGESCTQLTYRLFASVTSVRAKYHLYFDGPCHSLLQGINLYVDILPCPLGFELYGEECVCDDSLRNFTQSCFVDNVAIERKTNNFWISQQINNSGLINGMVIHQTGCPLDYCTSSPINVTLDNPNVQCDNSRKGILCGACKQNFSLTLGSLHCNPCSNAYLALIIPFALAGMALVVALFVLRLTVAAGTLNGLIFYANIVQANHQAFFPRATINFFTVFISWMNLDLGIEACFYNGMDMYAYSWLQFLFPFYVWLLIVIIIITSHYSQRIANLLGRNPVAVLATLFLMSYSKILTAIITPLQSTTLKHTIPNETYSRVWLYDANIPYFREPGHIMLGVFALFALLFLFLPYTTLLICGHWLQIKSHWWILSWINQLKPFMDVYHAPYKKYSRYWIGLLLLTRCGLLLTFAYGGSRVNLLAASTVCIALAFLKERVYEKHYNDILESSFILNLGIFAAATLFLMEGTLGSQYVLSSISVGTSFTVFIGIVVFHVYQQLKGTSAWKNVKSQVEMSHLCDSLFGRQDTAKDKQNKSELTNIQRQTTELIFDNNSTKIAIRESLLENAIYI